MATVTAAAPPIHARRRPRRAGRAAAEPGTDAAPDSWWASAAANWATEAKRSAGVFTSARAIAVATRPGTAGRMVVTLGAAAVRCWWTRLSTVGPVKGGCPANISYSTQARE